MNEIIISLKNGESKIMRDDLQKEEKQPDNQKDKFLEVHFKSLKTGEKAQFKLKEDVSLDAAWNEANDKLEETRSSEDTLRCAGGTDLTNQLQKTVGQIRDEKVCVNLHFEIKGPSGGARA